MKRAGRWAEVEEFRSLQDEPVRRGDLVQLVKALEEPDRFIYVRNIIKNSETGEVDIRGLELFRVDNLSGMLDPHLNELYIYGQSDRDDQRHWSIQCMVTIQADQVWRKRKFQFSFNAYPFESFRDGLSFDFEVTRENRDEVREYILVYQQLTCRRVHIDSFTTSAVRLGKHHAPTEVQTSLMLLTEREIGQITTKTPLKPAKATVFMPQVRKRERPQDDEELSEASPQMLKKYQEYLLTYADAFCGAGGAAQGAQDAGFTVIRACDHAKWAADSFKMNFPDADVEQCEIHKWNDRNMQPCSVLHISSPCCTWSTAHTVAGRNDDANSASLLAVYNLINTQKPRVVTLEQVWGLTKKKDNRPFFSALINQIATAGSGYNVRWSLFNFREYGLPSRRMRIIIFASE